MTNVGELELVPCHDSYAFLFDDLVRLIDYFPKWSAPWLAFSLLALTGMRLETEFNSIGTSNFYRDTKTVAWNLGKNQTGMREVALPDWFWEGYDHYVAHHPTSPSKLFPFDSDSLRRNYLHPARKLLGGNFLKKKRTTKKSQKFDYIISMKSFRHTYQCFLFWRYYKEYKDANISAAFVAAEMKHSGEYTITARFYLRSIHYMRRNGCLEKYEQWTMADVIKKRIGQEKLISYVVASPPNKPLYIPRTTKKVIERMVEGL